MALVKCEEIGRGKRRYTLPPDYNLAVDEPEVEVVRTWRLTSDDANDHGWTLVPEAQSDGSLPSQWDRLDEDDPSVIATTFAVEEKEEPEVWEAQVTYKLVIDPTAEPGLWRRSTGQNEVALDMDATGAAYLNSAGDPFDPPPTAPEPYLIMSCQKNRASIDENDIIENFLHCTNSVGYRGIGAGLVYLADFQANPAFRFGVHYFETTWTFWARARGWGQSLLDCGFRHWPGAPFAATVRRTIRGPDGQPVSSPALLDGSGRKLTPGSPPVFLPFTPCNSADFNSLGLDGR